MSIQNEYLNGLMERVVKRDPAEPEFHQAVREVLTSLAPVANARPELIREGVMDCLVEPERTIKFRVPWEDDKGNIHVNRGFRVQFNSAIGPYKGGLRFHPRSTRASSSSWALSRPLRTASPACPSAAARAAPTSIPRASRTPRSCASASPL